MSDKLRNTVKRNPLFNRANGPRGCAQPAEGGVKLEKEKEPCAY